MDNRRLLPIAPPAAPPAAAPPAGAGPTFTVFASTRPFLNRHYRAALPAGTTVAEAVEAAVDRPGLRPFARAWIDGQEVPAELFPRVRPKAGHVLAIAVPPGQGAFGPQYSGIPPDTLRMGLLLLFGLGGAALPAVLGLEGLAAAAVSTGITLVGAAAVNALVPLPNVDLDERREGITGSQNRLVPFGPVPRVYGRMRLFPPHASRPFTAVEGNDQYLYCLFCLGYGELEVELDSLRIGNTRLRDFQGVRFQIFPAGTPRSRILFPDNVQEEQIQKKLEYAEDWTSTRVQTHTTRSGTKANELSIDITFPQGLYSSRNSQMDGYRVDVAVEYRLKGTEPWLPVRFDDSGPVEDDAAAVTPSNLFGWLETLQSHLEDVHGFLSAVDLEDRIMTPQMQASLLERIEDKLDRIEGLVADSPERQAQIDALAGTLQDLWDLLQTATTEAFGESPEPLWPSNIAELVRTVPALTGWMELNRQIYSGNADMPLSAFSPFLAWRVWRMGLYDIFADPEPGSTIIHDRSNLTVRRGFSWQVDIPGEYDVRIRRTSKGSEGADPEGGATIVDECVWTALRAVEHRFPVLQDGVTLLAVKIRATDQLNGVIDTLSVVATAKLPTWDGTQWTEPVATRNPAWALCDVLRGPANRHPVADDRLDLAGIKAWADWCAAQPINPHPVLHYKQGVCCDAVVDRDTTVYKLLQDICAVGRASFAVLDGLYTVVVDKDRDVPVQHFTPANSRGFTLSRAYPDLPHALKLRFVDRTSDWQDNERIVYMDGYSAAAGATDPITGQLTEAATVFEEADLWGVTEPDQVWWHGRYTLAVGRLRPEAYTLDTDLEYLVCQRGDLVRVTHDVPMWGLSYGRVRAVTVTDGRVTAVALDRPVELSAAFRYQLRVRTAAGASQLADVATPAEDAVTDVLEVTGVGAFAPAAGDLFMFGHPGTESVLCLVKEIEPRDDYTAEMTLVPYAPEVFTSDVLPIPDWDGQITIPPHVETRVPPLPVVDRIVTDETALEARPDGTLETRILVLLKPWATAAGNRQYAVPRTVQVQHRPAQTDKPTGAVGETAWISGPVQPADALAVYVAGVREGGTYDVRLRYIAELGQAGEWITLKNIYVEGKVNPPPDVDFLLREGDWIIWAYPDPPLDLAGFHVREAAGIVDDWGLALPAHDGLTTETRFLISGATGARTYLVKAVDTGGRESASAAILRADLGDPDPGNLIRQYDHRALDWPGTRTNCTVVMDNRLGAGSTSLFWGDADVRFWKSPATLFWDSSYGEMVYTWTYNPLDDEVGCRLWMALAILADNWRVEYRRDTQAALWPLDMDDPLWPEDLDDDFWQVTYRWLPFPGEIIVADEQYQFRIWVSAAAYQSVINEWVVALDLPDREYLVNDFAVAPAGSRPTMPEDWRATTNVQITLQQTGDYPDAHTAICMDKGDDTQGPLIAVRDAEGAATGGLVDLRIKGY